MNQLKKWLSALLCACMLFSSAALAEDAAVPTDAPVVTDAVAQTEPEIADDTLLATINGEEIKWADIKADYDNLVSQYGSYYDMADAANVKLFRAVALESQITEVILMQKAKELGLDQLTEEEITETNAKADADWQGALDNYVSYYYELTDTSTEEEKAEASAAALAYYTEMGYSPEVLRKQYMQYEIFSRVENLMTQDATITDEEVESTYQSLVAADKELYENDLAAYIEYNDYVDQMAWYATMYGSASDMDKAWYRPAGFRSVKHILLPVDEALMSQYTDLQARLEEQMNAESGEGEAVPSTSEEPTVEPAADATPQPSQEPVSPADLDKVKADILASLADKIDEINQKIADGADFDELIATYGVNADGTPSDPGMQSEPYKTSGYEVARESANYVPEFVEASFSVDQIGDVSAPYLSDFGVHIVKYISDVEPGPIAMTDAQRTAKRDSMLEEKKSDLYTAQMEKWLAESNIVYAGIIPSVAEIESQQADAEPTADDATPTAVPAE